MSQCYSRGFSGISDDFNLTSVFRHRDPALNYSFFTRSPSLRVKFHNRIKQCCSPFISFTPSLHFISYVLFLSFTCPVHIIFALAVSWLYLTCSVLPVFPLPTSFNIRICLFFFLHILVFLFCLFLLFLSAFLLASLRKQMFPLHVCFICPWSFLSRSVSSFSLLSHNPLTSPLYNQEEGCFIYSDNW